MNDVDSSKLGFVYLIETGTTGLYKIGFTESKLSGRSRKLEDRLGVSRVEAVVMTIDARAQEALAFEVAWKHADHIKTNLARYRNKLSELFVLDTQGIGAVRAYLIEHVGSRPYVHNFDASPSRLAAVRKAIEFNHSVSESGMTIQGMDKVLRKLNG